MKAKYLNPYTDFGRPGLSSSLLVTINCRLGMILGANVPSQSRLLSISKWPEFRLLTFVPDESQFLT